MSIFKNLEQNFDLPWVTLTYIMWPWYDLWMILNLDGDFDSDLDTLDEFLNPSNQQYLLIPIELILKYQIFSS